jgi:Fic-DOC domain mobile mystery protein B
MTDRNRDLIDSVIYQAGGATPLDPDELEGLKFKHVTTRAELDQLEQASVIEGLNWLARQKNPDVLSEAFVLALHQKLFGNVWRWAGTFRRTEKNIGVDPIQIAIQLRQLMDDTKYWINHETYSPKELAARFHHRLVFIHPFPNGNGRHARIMTDAILTKLLREPAIDWSAGHTLETMSERRVQYIAALRAADGHDYSALLRFVGA